MYLLMSLFGQNTEHPKKKWLQHINRMACNRLLRIIKYYRPPRRKNQGSPLKRLWNVSDQGQKVAQIHVSLMMMMMTMMIMYCLYQHFEMRLDTACIRNTRNLKKKKSLGSMTGSQHLWQLLYVGGPKRNRKRSLVGRPVVVHASAAR